MTMKKTTALRFTPSFSLIILSNKFGSSKVRIPQCLKITLKVSFVKITPKLSFSLNGEIQNNTQKKRGKFKNSKNRYLNFRAKMRFVTVMQCHNDM